MQVKDIMAIGAVTIDGEKTVVNAALLMKGQSVGMLVVSENSDPVGVVTDRDLLTGCVGQGHNPAACAVGNHASEEFITTTPAIDALDAARLMRQMRIRRLPVLDDSDLVGVVSFSDIARSFDSALRDVLLGMSTPAHVSAVTLAGRVTHYYTHLGVAAIQVGQAIRVGDTIYITGRTTNIEQTVDSMQLERGRVEIAVAGQNVGIKVTCRVRTGDTVYLAAEARGDGREQTSERYAAVG